MTLALALSLAAALAGVGFLLRRRGPPRDGLAIGLRHRRRLQSLGAFAGGLAHRLNNVLLPLTLHAEKALADLPRDSAARADLGRVLDCARRAKTLVEQILKFGRMPADAALGDLDLRAVLVESLTLFEALAPPAITVRAEIGETIPHILGDAALAFDAIANLGTNALQAMQGKTGTLTLGLRYPQGGGQSDCIVRDVELWVQDTGHGMDAATAARSFEPFFTTRPGAGTGLGLSAVREIVARFGGRIEVESARGAGTTVRMFFAPVLAHDAKDR